MRVYRNEYKVEGESQGFTFHTTAVAAAAARETFRQQYVDESEKDPEVVQDQIDLDLTRAGVLKVLREWAAHADNG
jgi:hydrogenase maturation factor